MDSNESSQTLAEKIEGCVFCRIIKRQEPANEVMRGNGFVAFVPLNPVTEGHILFVPDRHATRLEDLAGVEIEYALHALGRFAKETGEDYNVIQSNGEAATQTIGHVHFHLVPRREGDGLMLPWSMSKFQPLDTEEAVERIIEAWVSDPTMKSSASRLMAKAALRALGPVYVVADDE